MNEVLAIIIIIVFLLLVKVTSPEPKIEYRDDNTIPSGIGQTKYKGNKIVMIRGTQKEKTKPNTLNE